VKKKLHLHPFKIKKHQKLRRGNRLRRLQMCGRLAVRPRNFYRRLLVTDEAWCTLNGHVFNRC